MKLRRRPQPPPPVLGEDAILLLLLGTDAPTRSAVKRLLFTSEGNYRRVIELWEAHKDVALAEAKRRGIARPFDADFKRDLFFGERCIAMAKKCPERFGG